MTVQPGSTSEARVDVEGYAVDFEAYSADSSHQ